MTNALIKSDKNHLTRSGDLLISDFQSAMVNRATADAAKYEADRSEQLAVQNIADTEITSNPVYVTPQDIPLGAQQSLAHDSVDAHMKKVQAQQIAQYSATQIAQMEQDDRKKYKGVKVTLTIIDQSCQPVESVWFNNKTGEYNQSIVTKKVIKGIIEEIDFKKNLLTLRPALVSRLILPSRKLFAVYVINPTTLRPAISLSM